VRTINDIDLSPLLELGAGAGSIEEHGQNGVRLAPGLALATPFFSQALRTRPKGFLRPRLVRRRHRRAI
jgi:hypothetical protein